MRYRVLFLAVFLCGCTQSSGTKDREGPRSFDAKGTIVALPAGEDQRVAICHAAIPGLGPDGRNEPSDPALMPFWLKDVTLMNGLKVGDPVEFAVSVDWTVDRPVVITALKRLDTRAVFECR